MKPERMIRAGELEAKGWSFDNESKCRAEVCKAEIEWWLTAAGKSIPLDAGTLVPHWGTCKASEQFRKKG